MIKFDEEKHEYTLDGKKLISVTQLMKKHGLSPNYGNVPQEVLKAKAERGTLIHKEIEEYIKKGEIGFTTELANFINAAISVKESELRVHNDIVAGTIDLVLEDGSLADIKTTAARNEESIKWQLSIYNYLYDKENYKDTGKGVYFDKDGNIDIVTYSLKPIEEVEKLMNCERNGELYAQAPVMQDYDLTSLIDIEKLIKHYDTLKKEAEERAVAIRSSLQKAMEENEVKTLETEAIKITYVAPTTRTTIDSTKLKKELPEVFEKYQKTSNVKGSLRITFKEEKNE